MASSYRSYTVEYSGIIIRQQCGGSIHAESGYDWQGRWYVCKPHRRSNADDGWLV